MTCLAFSEVLMYFQEVKCMGCKRESVY